MQQPPDAPVPLQGKTGRETAPGYQRSSTGKWAWSSPKGPQQQETVARSRSLASLNTNHAAPSVSHPAKDLKVLHASATGKNFVGSEFRNAGQIGLEIWRMENMTAKPIPKEQHGKFYTGDAYIVLNVTSERSSTYHIHFWIGKESSQDKYGTAAYKTVELDNKFTGSAIHHREEQGKESDLFKSYFKDGIEYLKGGSASSFRHVQREVFAKRLLHLKGRRSVKVKQVEATYKSMNSGDVFVLDVGRTIFQWNGAQASRTERVKGVEVIRNIKDNERGGRATIIVVEESKEDNKKAEQFWEALGDRGPIADAESAGDDDEFEKKILEEIVLHKIYVEKNQVLTEIVTTRPLKKEILDPHNAYVLDATTEVFAWLGKSNSANQKNFAGDFAKKIHSEKVSWAPFVKIVQGAETPMFKEKFDNWKQLVPKYLDYGVSAQLLPSFAKRTEYPKDEIDLEKLINTKPKPRPENALLHAGTGVLKIWKIEDFKKVELPESQHGIFFSSSCYICLYVEIKDQRRSHYIYFWQGRHSSKESKGTSALLAKEMADTIRGKQQQFRVVHNKEPEHFIMLFKGKMIIGMGEHPKTREDLGGLYHIKYHPHNWEWHIKAAQVPMTCDSLNSGDVFVMVTADNKCFRWIGIGSSSAERKVAKLVAARLVGDANVGKIITVDEGKEVSFFWPYFPGGKKEYANAEYLKWNSKSPRLFQCSNTTGTFKVEEILNFTQEDLDNGDPFILDCYAEVYVWVGTGSNEIEKKFAMQTALEYVAKASSFDERDPSTPIYYVNPGEEPLQFKCHFLAWDNDLIADSKKEDEDDGTPLKSSIVFRSTSFNPEPQKPNFPALKSQPIPDPNRPKLSFSYPSPRGAPETKQAPEPAKPSPLAFSYPKPDSAPSPRGTLETKPAHEPIKPSPLAFSYPKPDSAPSPRGAPDTRQAPELAKPPLAFSYPKTDQTTDVKQAPETPKAPLTFNHPTPSAEPAPDNKPTEATKPPLVFSYPAPLPTSETDDKQVPETSKPPLTFSYPAPADPTSSETKQEPDVTKPPLTFSYPAPTTAEPAAPVPETSKAPLSFSFSTPTTTETKQELETAKQPLTFSYPKSTTPEPTENKPTTETIRPSLSFSYPKSTTPEPTENKHTDTVRPSLSFSYPKSSISDLSSAPTTPRGTVIKIKSVSTPRANGTTTSPTKSSGLKTSSETVSATTAEITSAPADKIPAESAPSESPPSESRPSYESAPAETAPTKSVSIESASSESRPSESRPSESRPSESSSSESGQAESTPSESAPSESAPSESAPAESAPVESAPSESAPAESAPVESAPVESAPVESASVESAPAESTPAESAPVAAERAPAESGPAESAPAESGPAASAPAESVPDERVPIKSTTTEIKAHTTTATEISTENKATAETAPAETATKENVPTTTSAQTESAPTSTCAPTSTSAQTETPPTTACAPPTKSRFTINLSSVKAALSPGIYTPTSPATYDNTGAGTPGRAISTRPPWVKTKAEKVKLAATNPMLVAVLSPRTVVPSTPTKSTIITTTITATPTSASVPAAFLAGASAAVASAASVAAAASINAAIAASSPTLTSTRRPSSSTEPPLSPPLASTRRPSFTPPSPAVMEPSPTLTPTRKIFTPPTPALLDPAQEKAKPQEFQKINIKPKPLGLVQVELAKYNREFYTYEELSARKKPIGIDVTCLEKYLEDEEFVKIFGMTKEKFYQIPVWKRVTLRKDKKLY